MEHNFVLGLGANVDYEIQWDSTTLEDLIATYAVRASDLSTSVVVQSERDLVRSVLAFVRDGVGGERFVASPDIIEAFAARFSKRITLGGTGVRAALAMEKLGVPSTVHLVSIDDHVRRLLPRKVSYLCSAQCDSTHPHLIVQSTEGASVCAGDIELRAPRSNRIIYVNDPANHELVLSEELGRALSSADVFLVSGFNSIQDEATLQARLRDLERHMRSLPSTALVLYEDAGFHVPALSAQVREAILDRVDVYSMNEDEMQAYVGRSLDLLDADAMVVALHELHALVPAKTLVVHTSAWALALGERAHELRPALQGGVVMAGTRYVYGDDFTKADYHTMAHAPVNDAGRAFAVAVEALAPTRLCCVPAFRLRSDRPTTVGLGDAFVGGFLAALTRRRGIS
jgi:ADP-dependent phosphofructokinase/glucokinase